jgi:hypothetical protein
VGLMLDKSRGLTLGPELVVNGGFDSDTAWTKGAGWTISGGKLVATSVASGVEAKQSIPSLVAGYRYIITFDVSVTSGILKVNLGDLGFTPTELFVPISGSYSYRPANSGAAQITFWAASTFTGTIDNISVRELPGSHAFQTTSTSRPVLSARYNLGLNSGFSLGSLGGLPTDWLERSAVTGRKIADSSTLSGFAMRVTSTGVGGTGSTSDVRQGFPQLIVGASYIASFKVKAAPGNSAATITYVFAGDSRNAFITGEYTQIISSPFVAVGSSHAFFFGGANGLVADIADFQVVPANQADLPYQRVNTATDYDTKGFLPYLRADGVDDFMITNSINFTSTDKATIIAGLRKQNDTSSIVAELGTNINTNAGSFALISGEELGGRYSSVSRGNAPFSTSQQAVFSNTGFAPDTTVISATHDIAGDKSTIRRNVEDGSIAIGDKGTGNFGNYPLYLFRRGGTTMPFNGNLYSLIITGKQLTAQQLLAYESWANHRTFAVIDPLLIQEQVIGF